MVFLFVFFAIFTIFMMMIIFSKIIIEIDNLQFTSKENKKDRSINDTYKIIIKLKAFNKITLLKRVYDKKKIKEINEKLKINNKIKNINTQKLIDKIKNNKKLNTNIIIIFLKDMLEIVDINLKIEIGTKDAATTAILVGLISAIISIVFGLKIKKSKFQTYRVSPIYKNQNTINISISGIFGVKVIHIINIIYIIIKQTFDLKKGKVELNERTSNRKSYGYSHE